MVVPSSPRVTVVVPAYNAEGFIAETLRSIAEQTFPEWRCVIVDDGSTDRTARVVETITGTDPRFRMVQQVNGGVASARNHGARASGSEFLLFLDADDLLEQAAVEKLLALLVEVPHAPAAHGDALVVDEAAAPSDRRGYEQLYGRRRILPGAFGIVPRTESVERGPTGFDVLVLRNPITTPGQVLIRRHAFEGVGGFDIDAPPAEDWDLWLQLARRGPIAHLPEPVIRYRSHAGGASRQLSVMRAAELRVRHKAIRWSGVDPASGRSARALAKLSLRRIEGTRAGERLRSAAHRVVRGDIREAVRDVLRAGSSCRQVARSFLPVRDRTKR